MNVRTYQSYSALPREFAGMIKDPREDGGQKYSIDKIVEKWESGRWWNVFIVFFRHCYWPWADGRSQKFGSAVFFLSLFGEASDFEFSSQEQIYETSTLQIAVFNEDRFTISLKNISSLDFMNKFNSFNMVLPVYC